MVIFPIFGRSPSDSFRGIYLDCRCIDPGMSVKMSSMIPVMILRPFAEKINQLFMNKYRVDLKAINVLNSIYLSVTKIS